MRPWSPAPARMPCGRFFLSSFVRHGDSCEFGNSKLAHFVLERLPDDYMLLETDLRWLDECDGCLTGAPTNESVTMATKAAFDANPSGHIDPFELLIDAGICDTMCEPKA